MTIKLARLAGTALALSLALAGCSATGGSSGGSTPSPAPTPTPTPTPTPSPSPTPTGDIPRDAKIAFIGSSVVSGSGASSAAASWTTLITEYLDTRFLTVDSRLFVANRTNSEFGAYRIDSDLTRASFVPDIAFVSFTNDDTDPLAVKTFQDAIIFKLRQKNPNVIVILVTVAREADETERRAGTVPVRIAATRDLAAVEGAGTLFIDAGAPLWERVINGGTALTTYLSGGFPTDAGYKLYADAVIADLGPRLPTLTGANSDTSFYINDTKLGNARLLDPGNATNTCVPYTASSNPYLSRAIACTAGQTLTLDFSGTTLGITRSTIGDGGNLVCSVDGGAEVTTSFYEAGLDAAALRPIRLFENLSNASHRLTCNVSATSPAGSSGSRVIIGSFFVSSGRVLTN